MTDDNLTRYLAELYRNAARYLVKHATVAVGCSHAEDLVAVVFEEVWAQRQTVFQRSLRGQRAWAFTVLHHKIIDLFRGTQRATDPVRLKKILDRFDRRPTSTLSSVFLSETLNRCRKVI